MRTRAAFTLVEAMVVVVFLGILAAIAIPRVSQATTSPQIRACRTNVALLNTQIEIYHLNTGQWPKNLKAIAQDTSYFPDGQPTCPFGTKYKYDKNSHSILSHTH
jgi:general secretion pathway protein G